MHVLVLLITVVVNQVVHVGCLRCPALTQALKQSSLTRQADAVRKALSSQTLSIWSVTVRLLI